MSKHVYDFTGPEADRGRVTRNANTFSVWDCLTEEGASLEAPITFYLPTLQALIDALERTKREWQAELLASRQGGSDDDAGRYVCATGHVGDAFCPHDGETAE